MAGDFSDYRNVIMILHYFLGITPPVVIIIDWLKMLVSYMRVEILYVMTV